MARYTISEVCRALEVKPHIIRYWEQEIGILSPTKDRGGRRVFSEADLQLLFRIKYLVYEKKFTVEGAAQQIIRETEGSAADAKARIHAVRGDLLDLLGKIRKHDADTDQ
jgi:DNA-binding transcriptional MerR regulator